MFATTVYPLVPEEIIDVERSWDTSLDAELPPMDPFPFFDLPPELRLRIYKLLLKFPKTIDLDRTNATVIAPSLSLLRVSKKMYEEAYRVFFGHNTFRIFATVPPFYGGRWHILMRLKPHHRACITSIELRLGPGFSKPPRSWSLVNNKLGLKDCKQLRTLKVFVEFDPMGMEVFKEWRMTNDGFTVYCRSMLHKLLERVSTFERIEFDGWPSVTKNGKLMSALIAEASASSKLVTYGPERGWSHTDEVEDQVDSLIDRIADSQLLLAGGLQVVSSLAPSPAQLIEV